MAFIAASERRGIDCAGAKAAQSGPQPLDVWAVQEPQPAPGSHSCDVMVGTSCSLLVSTQYSAQKLRKTAHTTSEYCTLYDSSAKETETLDPMSSAYTCACPKPMGQLLAQVKCSVSPGT